MPSLKPESKWSVADPVRRAVATAEYQRLYRRNHPHAADVPPPISRRQALDEDRAQQRALMELEGRRIGRRRAMARYDAWERGERQWIEQTTTRYRLEAKPDDEG